MAETVVYTPENSGNSVPAWMAMNNGFLGNNGLGGGILGFLLGLFFGNGWGGFGGFGGGNGAGAGFLSNQINNDSGRELLMNAITSQGEAGRAATQNLATMLGQDYNQVSAAIATMQAGLSNLALQQAVSVPQVINAIQSGDNGLMSKLCECCCQNKLLTTQLGYESQIRTIEQTNTLGSQAERNTASVVGAINDLKATTISEFCAARERDMQSKIDTQADIITQLRNQLDNDRQTAQLQAIIAPLQQQVNNIAAKQINTVPVAWPNLQAVNTTPYMGGFYGNGINF